MRNLELREIQNVNGAGIIGETWEDIKTVVDEIEEVYGDAIEATTNMMCIGTGDCDPYHSPGTPGTPGGNEDAPGQGGDVPPGRG